MTYQAVSFDYEATMLAYYNARDPERIAAFVRPAVHYFPAGETFPDVGPQTAFVGADAIGRGFSS